MKTIIISIIIGTLSILFLEWIIQPRSISSWVKAVSGFIMIFVVFIGISNNK